MKKSTSFSLIGLFMVSYIKSNRSVSRPSGYFFVFLNDFLIFIISGETSNL